jgi:vitamin B12 transporter
MKYRRTSSLLVLLGAAHSSFALDQTPLFQGDTIVVTATRLSQKLGESLQGVSVITAQEIRDAGHQTLVELLQSRGGLESATSGGMGQLSSVFVRGTNSSHVLVLVDGLRIGSATAGTTALESIQLDQVDHIEIVRGPLSARYGSDAIGGVIQIFTQRGEGPIRPSISLGAGSFGTRSAAVAAGTAADGLRLQAQAGYVESAGFSATNATAKFGAYNPDKDAYRNADVAGALSYQWNENHEVGGKVFESSGRAHFDATATTDDYNDQRLSGYSVYMRNQLTPLWESMLRLGLATDDRVTVGAYPSTFRTDQEQALWQNTLLLPHGRLVAGLEYLGQKVGGTTTFTQTRRTTRSAFAGYEAQFHAHRLQADVRHDDNSQFGAHDTGSLAYGYRINPAWEAVASAGTAFKAPTFNDLYYPFTDYGYGYTYSGNPNLKPERSWSREVGVRYRDQRQRWSVVVFDNRIVDLIALRGDYSTVVNVGLAHIRGQEIEYRGKLGEYALHASATFQQPEDVDTGKPLARRSREFGTLGVERASGAWRLGAEMVATGARYDSAAATPDTRMGGYALFNFNVEYRIAADVSLRARWNNVFDRQYELVQGYNTPGSNLFVSLQYQPR